MRTDRRLVYGALCPAYETHQPTSYKLGKLGCIPGNRSPIMTQAGPMVDGIVGGKQHVVGQSENVLRHSRGCGKGSEASRGIAT